MIIITDERFSLRDVKTIISEYNIGNFDSYDVGLVDQGKIESFLEKFESIPETDLEEFLNKY